MVNNERDSLHSFVPANVLSSSRIHAHAHQTYLRLNGWYRHQIVDHAYAYVVDNVHPNGLENSWSLLKPTVRGTYLCVEPSVFIVISGSMRSGSTTGGPLMRSGSTRSSSRRLARAWPAPN